ncbi:unnamed protein product [Oppiella nova]|uniref:Uncharacterized protein n=1 Tax=Oppiella nova TaxID=334625 RepID=A0A7R9QGG8_9ACAR|nr:unnamed protein product [Oppiella nova]CAG2165440.1 unnamed protein product [Oppiella nova]
MSRIVIICLVLGFIGTVWAKQKSCSENWDSCGGVAKKQCCNHNSYITPHNPAVERLQCVNTDFDADDQGHFLAWKGVCQRVCQPLLSGCVLDSDTESPDMYRCCPDSGLVCQETTETKGTVEFVIQQYLQHRPNSLTQHHFLTLKSVFKHIYHKTHGLYN